MREDLIERFDCKVFDMKKLPFFDRKWKCGLTIITPGSYLFCEDVKLYIQYNFPQGSYKVTFHYRVGNIGKDSTNPNMQSPYTFNVYFNDAAHAYNLKKALNHEVE